VDSALTTGCVRVPAPVRFNRQHPVVHKNAKTAHWIIHWLRLDTSLSSARQQRVLCARACESDAYGYALPRARRLVVVSMRTSDSLMHEHRERLACLSSLQQTRRSARSDLCSVKHVMPHDHGGYAYTATCRRLPAFFDRPPSISFSLPGHTSSLGRCPTMLDHVSYQGLASSTANRLISAAALKCRFTNSMRVLTRAERAAARMPKTHALYNAIISSS